MVYVTADLHGDFSRLKSKEFKKVRRKDTVIVLGDFGFLWRGDKLEQKLLKKLGKLRFNLLFIDGCHENFTLLNHYETVEYAGGNAKHISGKLHYLLKGQIYNIENKTLLCFGGGESEERYAENEGLVWWRAELPEQNELDAYEKTIAQHTHTVDYILTHDAPGKLLRFMKQEVEETSWLQNYLDTIADTVTYKKWYFGRYHRDIILSSKAVGVYNKVLLLD